MKKIIAIGFFIFSLGFANTYGQTITNNSGLIMEITFQVATPGTCDQTDHNTVISYPSNSPSISLGAGEIIWAACGPSLLLAATHYNAESAIYNRSPACNPGPWAQSRPGFVHIYGSSTYNFTISIDPSGKHITIN